MIVQTASDLQDSLLFTTQDINKGVISHRGHEKSSFSMPMLVCCSEYLLLLWLQRMMDQ
jgi:hypothetical protein